MTDKWPIPDEGCISVNAESAKAGRFLNVTEALADMGNRIVVLERRAEACKRAHFYMVCAGLCMCAAIIIGAFR